MFPVLSKYVHRLIYCYVQIMCLKNFAWKMFSRILCFILYKAEVHPLSSFLELWRLTLIYENRKDKTGIWAFWPCLSHILSGVRGSFMSPWIYFTSLDLQMCGRIWMSWTVFGKQPLEEIRWPFPVYFHCLMAAPLQPSQIVNKRRELNT